MKLYLEKVFFLSSFLDSLPSFNLEANLLLEKTFWQTKTLESQCLHRKFLEQISKLLFSCFLNKNHAEHAPVHIYI
jgi:hypothetical protein